MLNKIAEFLRTKSPVSPRSIPAAKPAPLLFTVDGATHPRINDEYHSGFHVSFVDEHEVNSDENLVRQTDAADLLIVWGSPSPASDPAGEAGEMKGRRGNRSPSPR